jgi:hypothetical protein
METKVRNSIVRPSAGDILRGADTQLIELSRRTRRAERAADKQTEKTQELQRQLRAAEPSVDLAAENARLRAQLADYHAVLGVFAGGDVELGKRLAAIVAPRAARFAARVAHDPERLADALRERSELRRRYVHDANGHRVRADQVDANRKCPQCRREDRRASKARSEVA